MLKAVSLSQWQQVQERGKPTVEIGKVIQLISILGLDINIDVRGR